MEKPKPLFRHEKNFNVKMNHTIQKQFKEITRMIMSEPKSYTRYIFNSSNQAHLTALGFYNILQTLSRDSLIILLNIDDFENSHKMIKQEDISSTYRFETLLKRFDYTTDDMELERQFKERISMIDTSDFMSKLAQSFMLKLIIDLLQKKSVQKPMIATDIIKDILKLCFEYSLKNTWHCFFYKKIVIDLYFEQKSISQEDKDKTMYDMLKYAILIMHFFGNHFNHENPSICIEEFLFGLDSIFMKIENYTKIKDHITSELLPQLA